MSALNGIGGTGYDPRYNPYIERVKAKDLSALTFEETAVLDEVKSVIASLGDSAVKVQVTNPEAQESGNKISIMGFMGTGVGGTGDFAIGTDYLTRMAADENYKKEVLAEIRGMIATERKNIAETAKLQQAKPVEVPKVYMDFWNEDKNETKAAFKNLYEQVQQTFADKYEANFTYQ